MTSEPARERKPLSLSVVIPTFNRQELLSACLGGLARQTATDFEVIVVDDGSKDGTREFLEQFADGHPDIDLRAHYNEANLGANNSRNAGARLASGDIVAFLDSDAVPEPDWVERLVEAFADERVAAVTGGIEEPVPANVWELAYKGTHRIGERGGIAARLAIGNMGIRRHLMLTHPLEEDLKYGCNEEGIYLRLRALGFTVRAAPSAIIFHDHRYDRSEFYSRARVLGKASAWLVYKYYLPPRLDLLPFLLGYAALAFSALVPLALVPAGCFLGAGLAALAYNDVCNKGKTVAETARSFPGPARVLPREARVARDRGVAASPSTEPDRADSPRGSVPLRHAGASGTARHSPRRWDGGAPGRRVARRRARPRPPRARFGLGPARARHRARPGRPATRSVRWRGRPTQAPPQR